jgi:hypothetical protein
MNDRDKLINLIGKYGRVCMARTASVATDMNDQIAAMKAVEDFCDAAIMAEREACKAIADDVTAEADKRLDSAELDDDADAITSAESRADAAATIANRIGARPAP